MSWSPWTPLDLALIRIFVSAHWKERPLYPCLFVCLFCSPNIFFCRFILTIKEIERSKRKSKLSYPPKMTLPYFSFFLEVIKKLNLVWSCPFLAILGCNKCETETIQSEPLLGGLIHGRADPVWPSADPANHLTGWKNERMAVDAVYFSQSKPKKTIHLFQTLPCFNWPETWIKIMQYVYVCNKWCKKHDMQ